MFNNWAIFDNHKNIVLTPKIKEQLSIYYEFLIAENSKYNLTRITDENEVYEKHFLDSLLFTDEFPITNQTIADIGTGPGFPGVVIKIFFPETQITLIESNAKKIKFLEMLIDKLGLEKIGVSNIRVEEFDKQAYETYDVVISRAVAYLDILLEIGVQLVKVKGNFIILKGPRAIEELKYTKDKDQKLSLKLIKTQMLDDIGFGVRINLFYQKEKSTPTIYPRKYSLIKKESK